MDKMELSKRLEQLVGEAAAQEGRLEMTQVLDHFRDVQMTPEEMEDVYLKLERKGVHIQAPEEPEEELPEGDFLLDDDAELDQPSLAKEEFRWGRDRLDPDEMLDGGSMVSGGDEEEEEYGGYGQERLLEGSSHTLNSKVKFTSLLKKKVDVTLHSSITTVHSSTSVQLT